MLRDVAREVLAEKCTTARVRRLVEAPVGSRWDESLWQQLARPRGSEYVISGRKLFVPWARAADLIIVPARTRQTEDPERGITLFAIERDTPGVTVSPNDGIDQTSRTGTVELENVRIGR